MALKFELEVEEINTILRVLSKHPFEEVANLVAKINQQGNVQLADQAPVAATEETPNAI